MTNPLEAIFRAWADTIPETDGSIDALWNSFSEMVKKRYPFPVSGAVCDRIFAERCRQQEVEGYTLEHDDAHTDGEIAEAAACYATGDRHERFQMQRGKRVLMGTLWPWSLEWWKPKDRRRDLIRAAALIVAEIERLERAAAQHPVPLMSQSVDGKLVNVPRPVPFGPVGSGHVPSNLKEVPESVYAPTREGLVPIEDNRVEDYSGEVLSRTKDVGTSLVEVSITEEQFRRWAASKVPSTGTDHGHEITLTDTERDRYVDSWWQSFKEVAGWPKY